MILLRGDTMQFIEFTDPDSGISYQYSEFTIANVAFIINFCSMPMLYRLCPH